MEPKDNPIRWLRKNSLGVNQTEMAEEIGITQGALSKIERGRGLGGRTVIRVWELYGRRLARQGVSRSDLLSWGHTDAQSR